MKFSTLKKEISELEGRLKGICRTHVFLNQQKNKVPKENYCQPRIANPTKILFKKKNKTKTFPNK